MNRLPLNVAQVKRLVSSSFGIVYCLLFIGLHIRQWNMSCGVCQRLTFFLNVYIDMQSRSCQCGWHTSVGVNVVRRWCSYYIRSILLVRVQNGDVHITADLVTSLFRLSTRGVTYRCTNWFLDGALFNLIGFVRFYMYQTITVSQTAYYWPYI